MDSRDTRATQRIPALDPPYEPEVQRNFEALMPPGMAPLRLFRTLAQNPRVLGRIRAGGLLDRGSLTLRQRELMILRTTARTDAEYEWGVHVAGFAQKAGLTKDEVAATASVSAEAPSFNDAELALLRLADELHEQARPSEELWTTLAKHYSDAQLIELLTLAGFYHAIAFVVNGAGVALEEWAPRFPATFQRP